MRDYMIEKKPNNFKIYKKISKEEIPIFSTAQNLKIEGLILNAFAVSTAQIIQTALFIYQT